ncbi:hypothetical protein BDQ17DRAFT_1094306 [Cyathus striatus]|nr:hypothetical protein BDQ17DRAFT_1094306 [Cyathus striatus]
MPHMTIICEGLEKWPVHAIASRGGLRCIDVFKAIYKTFSEYLTRDEIAEAAARDPDYFRRCQRHFKQRCADAPGIDRVLERDGMCRVDLLKGRRVFKGLKQDLHDPEGVTFRLRIEDIWTQSRRN